MDNKKFRTLTRTELTSITGGDNESYDFWYRVGGWIRKNYRILSSGAC